LAATITTKIVTVVRKKYTSEHQSNLRSVQAESVNINAMDVFLPFTMVQQIMTELSDAAIEKENVAVITKAVFKLLKNNANNSS
jgi:hypothetical protein